MGAEGVDHLPRASGDQAVVYLIGPGFGESEVVLLPGGLCIVVDSCTRGGKNLTLALLEALGVDHVDLLVVTHPDLDHIRGIAELVAAFPPRRMWRYPSATVRDLVAHWCRRDPADQRLRELSAALEVLDALEAQGVGEEVGFRTRALELSDDVDVHAIAPTACDQLAERAGLRRILERDDEDHAIGAALRAFLIGEGRLADRPNTLSVALSVRCGDRRIVLAGDVENGRATQPASGWKGVLMHLREDGLIGVVEKAAVVKVAHHGSSGAFHPNAWRAHALGDRSTIAIIAPFVRGATRLPTRDVLTRLRGLVDRAGITSNAGDGFARATEAGWSVAASSPLASLGACLAVVVPGDGPSRLLVGAEASAFVAPDR